MHANLFPFIAHSHHSKFVRMQQETDTPSKFFAHANENKYPHAGDGRVREI
jgi:hypothetical protein